MLYRLTYQVIFLVVPVYLYHGPNRHRKSIGQPLGLPNFWLLIMVKLLGFFYIKKTPFLRLYV